MLDHLRDRAAKILAETPVCTLATTGPAGLQASMVHCTARATTLYLLIPDSSDHLFNLEIDPEVAVASETWHLRGTAASVKHASDVFSTRQRQWHTLVKVSPVRLDILSDSGTNYAETMDFDA